jgi:hypothetical protein
MMKTDTTTKYVIQHNRFKYWSDDDQVSDSDTFGDGVDALDKVRGWKRREENAGNYKLRLIKRTETVFDV